jgi:hypothetical protein
MKTGTSKAVWMIAFVLVVLLNCGIHAQVTADTSGRKIISLSKGEKASTNYFTGTVWLNPLASDTMEHWSIAKVSFEPGSRSHWHLHPGKQILVITEGVGYLKERVNLFKHFIKETLLPFNRA